MPRRNRPAKAKEMKRLIQGSIPTKMLILEKERKGMPENEYNMKSNKEREAMSVFNIYIVFINYVPIFICVCVSKTLYFLYLSMQIMEVEYVHQMYTIILNKWTVL